MTVSFICVYGRDGRNVAAVEKNENLEKILKFEPESGRRAELDSVCDGYCDAV